MKRTPWFSCKTPPVRIGMYETNMGCNGTHSRNIVLRYWNGAIWSGLFGFPQDRWRGLTAPEGKKK